MIKGLDNKFDILMVDPYHNIAYKKCVEWKTKKLTRILTVIEENF